jgi:hypothetical protein
MDQSSEPRFLVYLIRQKNLKLVRSEVRRRYDNDGAANLADTTQVDSNRSMPVTARNIGCFDPFSVLLFKGISTFRSCVVFAPWDIRDHRVFGGRHGRHVRGTACMGLLQAGWTKYDFPDRWDTGGLIQPIALDSDRAKTLITCPGSSGRLDDVPSTQEGFQLRTIFDY